MLGSATVKTYLLIFCLVLTTGSCYHDDIWVVMECLMDAGD